MFDLPLCRRSLLASPLLVSPVLAGLLLATGCHPKAQHLTEASAAVDRVTVGAPAKKKLTIRSSQPARIEAYEAAPVYAKVSGYVEQVHVDIGAAVKAGQVLITLREPELEDDVRGAEAQIADVQARVAQAEAGIKGAQAAAKTAEARIAAAAAGIAKAAADEARWKSEHARMTELLARGAVTAKLVDEALQQRAAAEAAGGAAQADVEFAKQAHAESLTKVDQAKADADAARAKLGVAQAQLARAKTLLAYAEIKAPFDGVVTQRHVDTGHYVSPADAARQPLLVVERQDLLRVIIELPEAEAALADVGDAAVISVSALRGREIKGQIARTAGSLGAGNRSLRIELDLPAAEAAGLRPGMYATATLILAEQSEALTLPASAIFRDGKQPLCAVLKGGKISRVKLQLGLSSGDDVEILDGLKGAEQVVLARGSSLTEGQAAEALPPPTPAK